MKSYDDDYGFNDIVSPKVKRSSTMKKKMIKELDIINHDSYENEAGFSSSTFLPSSHSSKKEKTKKEQNEMVDESYDVDYDPDEWFNTMMDLQHNTKKLKKKKIKEKWLYGNIFEDSKNKKKKKKKGDVNIVDYKKEFEPEMALYKNLLTDQNKFTQSLQREYDMIKGAKSSSRGMTKQITDLISNITSARSLSMQLIEKNANTKKLIAELTIKQKKELGGADIDSSITDYASTYLKQMFNERSNLIDLDGQTEVSDYTDDELFSELNLSLGEDTRDEDINKYLQYENRNVKIYVVIKDDDVENYYFLAEDEDGKEISDYPLPSHTSISVNRSTGIATDVYGQKYQIIWK